MEKLRIKIGKKKTVSAMVDEFTIGGTSDHNLLKNRDMNNQHPINAIDGLEDALNNRVTNENLIAEVDSALKSAKDSGLFDGKDGEDGHTPEKGVDYFDGEPGDDGIGILSVEQEFASNADGGENIIKITLTDGRVQRFTIKNGSGGEVEISQYDVIKALGYTPIDRDSIVDDLETNVVNYPLSAAQGAKLKRLIDDITVPTKTSQLTNDSKFMSTEEVVAKINEAISGVAGGLKFEIVDTVEDLPIWCDDSSTIYLVPSEKTEDNQFYNEYLWLDGRWEKFGDTQISLSNYYTQSQVDNLILNIQKSIPTKISQLYNDAGYVKAEDIETGEATWDSIKGNIVYPIEEFIEWDGNTEGLDTWGAGASIAYRVSDRVIRSEDFSKSGMTVYYDSGGSLGVASSLTATESDGKWYSTAYGVGCVFDSELAGLPEGIYFSAYNFSELGMPRKLGPFVKENIKHELLSEYFDTVDGKEIIKEEYLPPSVPLDGMTVKSTTFTDMKMLREWIVENQAKLLRVSFDMGNNIINFYNVTIVSNDSGVNFVSLDKLSVGGLSNLVSAVNEMEVRFYETNLTIFSNQTSIKEDGTCTFRNVTDQTIPYEYVPSTGITATVLYFD